jgi:hypothetical protein
MQKDASTDDDEESLCIAILQSGKRQGKQCGSKATHDNGTHCGRHGKEKTPQQVVLCHVLLKSGDRKGDPCHKKATYPGGVCGNHKKHGKKKEKEEEEDEETSVGASSTRCLDVVTLDTGVYVLGVNGSSVDKAAWKAFWIKHTKQEYPNKCRAKDCEMTATCTGHMYLRDDTLKRYNYLIPICSHHNGKEYDTKAFLLKKTKVAVKIRENPSVKL